VFSVLRRTKGDKDPAERGAGATGSADISALLVGCDRSLEVLDAGPRSLIVMGEESSRFLDSLDFPLADALSDRETGVLHRFTPTIEAILTPDIDGALDDQAAKTAFWNAFKALGPWWAQLPPY